jgi:hypothetical protein
VHRAGLRLAGPGGREFSFAGRRRDVRALLGRWLQAPGRTLTQCEIDLRVGGACRQVWSVRDAVMKAGLEPNALDTCDRLAALLVEIATKQL